MGDPRLLRDPRRLVVALVRHGRTGYNASRRFVGRTDVPLDAVGVAQAAALGEALRGAVDAVYSSPLVRALDTARAIDADPVVVPDLVELDQGALEGLEGREAFARFPEFFQAFGADPTDVAAPDGESLGALSSRVERALSAIASRHRPGELVVVVAHQLVIASVGCRVAGEPLSAWRTHAVDNGSVTAFQAVPAPWRRLGPGWVPDAGTGLPSV